MFYYKFLGISRLFDGLSLAFSMNIGAGREQSRREMHYIYDRLLK